MSNSRLDILAQLEQGSATFGWGAILAFGRDALNRLIKEQYIQGFEKFKFSLPFSERFPVNDDATEHVELSGIVLGEPRISFESASLNKAALTVTLNIIDGTYSSFREGVGVPPTLLTAFSISEAMGYHVRMQAEIHEILGEADQQGVIAVDLAIADEVVCNLSSATNVQALIGQHFRRYFVEEAGQRRRFVLGSLDFNGYDPLSPVRFAIRTHRAPGADDPLGDNYGDGAALVFIMLKAQNQEPPTIPTMPGEGSNFPYLIPDDREGEVALFSSTLLINHELRLYAEAEQVDTLKNLILPNQNLFVEGIRDEPYDVTVFGSLEPSPGSVTITPSTVLLTAEQSQPFSAQREDGTSVNVLKWEAVSPDFPTSIGEISSNGVYTVTDPKKMRRHRLPMVVTATYNQDGWGRVASALVQERFHSMDIAPQVHIRNGASQTPVAIAVSSLGDGPLEFEILEPIQGARLEQVDAWHLNYFPPPTVQPEPVLVQNIKVIDRQSGDQVQASIVLINDIELVLKVDPYYVTGVMPAEQVPLRILNDSVPVEDIEWSVIGEGDITEDGAFIVPQESASMISVVVSKLTSPMPGWPDLYGYSVINLQPVQIEYIPVRWEELQNFKLTAPSGVQAYANGFQQIPIVIEIETSTVDFDGQQLSIPVSDVELSKLMFFDQHGTDVPFIDELQEGIEYDSPWVTAAHTRDNRFNLYSPAGAGKNPRTPLPAPANDATRYRTLWLHIAREGSFTLQAKFQADDGTWWYSDVESGLEGKITVQGINPPTVLAENYDLTRDRVFSGEGSEGPDIPENPSYPDPFSFYLDSIDYWRLSYKRLNSYPVRFATVSVESNVSTIQWESEFLEETFFSYTGYAFYPMRYPGSDRPPAGLSFDIYYRGLLHEVAPDEVLDTAFVPDKKPTPGELLVSLHRVAKMPYWYDAMEDSDPNKRFREKLDPSVIFVLRDQEGNRHRLLIGFEAPSTLDSRNKLQLNIQ